MNISTDTWVFWTWRGGELNETIVFTWLVMALLTIASALVTSRLENAKRPSRWQMALEVIVETIERQIEDIGARHPRRYLPFVGTLFLFIATANLLAIVPGYRPPTGSLSTTAALAISVFIAVPAYGVVQRGFFGYLSNYVRPTVLMLPFNVIGEISRTVALAVRLYGNAMSGTVIIGILISIAPFFFPIAMQLLGLLTGMIQAYIFAVLSMVYIASATRAQTDKGGEPQSQQES